MKTEIRLLNGKPVIYVNGSPHHSIFCSVQEKFMQNFIDAGFQIFDTHPQIFNGWVGDDTYDYTITDSQIEAYLDKKKDAALILRFWMGHPDERRSSGVNEKWWLDKYPGHAVTTYIPDSSKFRAPSYASKKWRSEAGIALGKVIRHVEEKYGDRIFAYVPGAGPCGEWFNWYSYDMNSNINPPDYSHPMAEGFRDYLRELYRDDIAWLNAKWNSNYNSFNEIALPVPNERLSAVYSNLRDPLKEKPVLDFYEYYNSIVADTLIEWCGIAKDACSRQKLIMAFYGYQWISTERTSVARSGHIHLNKVARAPEVDIVVAPYIYDFREAGGVVSSQTVIGTIRNAGKMCLVEVDPATSIMPDFFHKEHLPETHAESIEMMKRDMAYVLMNGASGWFMDLMGGMYDNPQLIRGLAHVRETGEKLSLDAGTSCAEIAIILHDRASYYFREADPFLGPLTNFFKIWELERMGAPFDDLLLSNLADESIKSYKVYIIPDAVYLSDADREAIREKCCRHGSTVIWCYSGGVLTDGGMSLGHMQGLIGIKTGYSMEAGEVNVEVTADCMPYTEGIPKGTIYGTNGNYLSNDAIKEQTTLNIYPDSKTGFSVSPRFFADDPDAEVIGMLSGLDKPGLAVKKMPGWTSVFSSAPMIPKEILRNIARDAGCHIYTDFLGQTMACRNYFGFYAHESGECRVKLPYRAAVYEVFSGKQLAQSSDEIVLDVEKNTTFLLHYC